MEKKNNLELLRFKFGLTNRQFADFFGINETMYSKLKNGTYPIGDKTINRVRKAFPDYNYKWILFNEGNPKEENINEVNTPNKDNKIKSDYKDILLKTMAQRIEELEEKLSKYESNSNLI